MRPDSGGPDNGTEVTAGDGCQGQSTCPTRIDVYGRCGVEETDPALWLPGSFRRRPEWRWLRAEFLAATRRRRDPRIDDDWVVDARTTLRNRGCGQPKVAAVEAAREIWTGDPAVKGELEALLLTAEPFDRVAGRFGLPASVVEAYAAVFFAVRPMRRATDWLLTRAVGYSPFRGFTGPQPAAAWKLAALAGGPVLLDVVIAATTGRPLPEGFLKGTGRRRAYEDARIRLLAEMWVASMSATTDEEFARVAADRQQLRDLDARMTGRGTAAAQTVAAMEAFLTALPAKNRKPRLKSGWSEEAEGQLIPHSTRPGGGRRAAGDLPLDVQGLVDEVDAVHPAVLTEPAQTEQVGEVTTDVSARPKPGRLAGIQRPRRLAG